MKILLLTSIMQYFHELPTFTKTWVSFIIFEVLRLPSEVGKSWRCVKSVSVPVFLCHGFLCHHGMEQPFPWWATVLPMWDELVPMARAPLGQAWIIHTVAQPNPMSDCPLHAAPLLNCLLYLNSFRSNIVRQQPSRTSSSRWAWLLISQPDWCFCDWFHWSERPGSKLGSIQPCP